MILRPGDEKTLREALRRGGAAISRSLGVPKHTLETWAKKGIPARKEDARDFRELLRERRALVRVQQIRKRAEALVKRVTAPKLGKALGVSADTVRRWVKSKDPDRLAELVTGYERGKAARKKLVERQKRGRDDEKNFRQIVKAAGEIKEIPVPRTSEGVRSGKSTQGYRWTKAFRESLTRDALADVESWAGSLPKKYPLFQLVARVSELALLPTASLDREKKGGGNYPSVMVQLPHRKAGDFAIDALVTTGAFARRSDAIKQLSDRLYEMMQGGAVKVFVHSVEMKNYRRRTPEEQRALRATMRARRTRLGKKGKR